MADEVKIKPFKQYTHSSGITGEEVTLGGGYDAADYGTCKRSIRTLRDRSVSSYFGRTFKGIYGVRTLKEWKYGKDAMVLPFTDPSVGPWFYGAPELCKRFFGLLNFINYGGKIYPVCGGDAGHWHVLPFCTRTYDDYLTDMPYMSSPIEYSILPGVPAQYSYLHSLYLSSNVDQVLYDNFRVYMIFLYLATISSAYSYSNLRLDIAIYIRYPAYPGVIDFVPLTSLNPEYTFVNNILAISGAYMYSHPTNMKSEVEIFPLFRTNQVLSGDNELWFDNFKSHFAVVRLN